MKEKNLSRQKQVIQPNEGHFTSLVTRLCRRALEERVLAELVLDTADADA